MEGCRAKALLASMLHVIVQHVGHPQASMCTKQGQQLRFGCVTARIGAQIRIRNRQPGALGWPGMARWHLTGWTPVHPKVPYIQPTELKE